MGKEAVHMFDGRTMTRVGRLVLGGVGEHFNLMGTFASDSTFGGRHRVHVARNGGSAHSRAVTGQLPSVIIDGPSASARTWAYGPS
jgi:hypothetical protein